MSRNHVRVHPQGLEEVEEPDVGRTQGRLRDMSLGQRFGLGLPLVLAEGWRGEDVTA